MSDLVSRQDAISAIVHELDMIDHVPQWVSDRLVKALRGVPSIDAVPVKDGTLKARSGNYVTYRIDWLLDNLAQEISLLEGYRRGRKEDG